MTFRWTPEWIRKTVNLSYGSIEVCVDKTTGLISCPLCVSIKDLCPSENTPLVGVVLEKATYFFTIEDLEYHLKEHQKGSWQRWHGKIRYEEEEEPEDLEE